VSPGVVVGAGVLALLAVLALTPSTAGFLDDARRWPGRVLAPALGLAGGAGAALLAEGRAELVGFVVLAVACAWLVAVDVSAHRLPDVLLLPAGAVLLGALATAALVGGDPARLGRAVLAAVVAGVAFLVMALISPRSLGLGDVKLAAVLGLFLGWFGWSQLLVGTLAAFVLGGLVAIALLVTRRARRTTAIAFGPWLVAGAAVGAAWPVSAL
jgi:leader peptidase (prepilin peptidase) / N-methyltransferase